MGADVAEAVGTFIEVGYKASGTAPAVVVVGTMPSPLVSMAWSRLPSRPRLEELGATCADTTGECVIGSAEADNVTEAFPELMTGIEAFDPTACRVALPSMDELETVAVPPRASLQGKCK